MPSTQVFGPTKKRCSVVPVSMATLFPRRTILSCPWDRNLALCRSDTVTCAASNPAIVGHGSPPFGSMSGEERICEQTFFRRKASSCKRRRRFCRTMCRCFISSVIPGYIFHESCHEFGPSGEEGENTLQRLSASSDLCKIQKKSPLWCTRFSGRLNSRGPPRTGESSPSGAAGAGIFWWV